MDINDDARTEASSSANTPYLMMMPLVLTIQVHCDLCGKGSQSESPFLESTQDDRYAGYLPWHRYRRSPCLTGRVCRDKICLVCFNVFSFSPLKLKHKSWKSFVSVMRDTPAEGVTFRKSCARYIENVNRGTDYISILSNHTMKSKPVEIVSEDLFVFFVCVSLRWGGGWLACICVFVVLLGFGGVFASAGPLRIRLFCFFIEEHRQGRRRKESKTFVEEVVYDALYADKQQEGLFGQKSMCNLSSDEPAISGFWTRGEFNANLPGHHVFEDYFDSSVVQSVIHECGEESMQVGKDQALRKFQVLQQEQAQAKKTTEGVLSTFSAEQLLALSRSLQGLDSHNEQAPSEAVAESGAEEVEEVHESSSSEEEVGHRSLFQRLQAERVATKSCAPGKLAFVGNQSQGSRVASSGASVGSKSSQSIRGALSASSKKAPHPTVGGERVVNMLDDGRFRRLKDSCEKEFDELQDSLQAAHTLIDCDDKENTFGCGAVYLEVLKTKQTAVKVILNKARSLSRRIDKSVHQSELQHLAAKLNQLETEDIPVFLKFLGELTKPNGGPLELLEAADMAMQRNLKLNANAIGRLWKASVEKDIMHGNFEAAAQHALRSSVHAQQMLAVASEDKARTIIAFVVDEVLLSNLEKVKATEVCLKKSASVLVLLKSFSEALLKCGAAHEGEFLLAQAHADFESISLLILPSAAKLRELCCVVERMERQQGDPALANQASPLYSRFLVHETGKALVANARSLISQHSQELRIDSWIQVGR